MGSDKFFTLHVSRGKREAERGEKAFNNTTEPPLKSHCATEKLFIHTRSGIFNIHNETLVAFSSNKNSRDMWREASCVLVDKSHISSKVSEFGKRIVSTIPHESIRGG